jgi:threonine dehydratase
MPTDYLKKILQARVYDVAIESPLERSVGISDALGNNVLLKREDLQPVFSFKLRGAYNKMAHLSPAELKRGVICASAGNHAQGVALADHRDADHHTQYQNRRGIATRRHSSATRR